MTETELSVAISAMSTKEAIALRKILRRANRETLGVLANELSEADFLTDNGIDKITALRGDAFDEVNAALLLMLLNVTNDYTKELQMFSEDEIKPTKVNTTKLLILGIPLTEWLLTYKTNDAKRIKSNLRLARTQKLSMTDTIKGVKTSLRVPIRSSDFVAQNLAFAGARLTTIELAKKNKMKLRFHAIMDSRTSDFCSAHDGLIYDADSLDIPDLPAHPNCRSILIPFLDK